MAADFSNEPIAVRAGEAKRARSPLYRNVYANFCQGQLGAFDITVSFFQTRDAEGTGALVHEEQATVTMSPMQFKLFSQLCNGLTEAYEQTFTPIAVPEGAGNPNLAAGNIVKLMQEAKAKMEAELKLALPVPTASGSSTTRKQPPKRGRTAVTKKAT